MQKSCKKNKKCVDKQNKKQYHNRRRKEITQHKKLDKKIFKKSLKNMLTNVETLCYNEIVLNERTKSTLKNKQCKIQTK